MSEAKQKLETAIAALGLSITAEFVPFSQSRNKAEKHRSLNWRVTLKRDGRDVLTTDYSAGLAHCPAYRDKRFNQVLLARGGMSLNQAHAIEFETDTGRTFPRFGVIAGAAILPDATNVIWSLAQDSDVLDYPTFEEWADNFGYDPDSRSGEATYRACLEIALKLRAAIGDAGLETLREAGQDY